jgi:GNAT superfamily N-acetyltransferase
VSVPDRTDGPDADTTTDAWRIVEDHPGSEVGAALVDAQWRELMRRYGVPDDRDDVTDDLEVEHLAPPHGVFLVGWADGVPVACGGVRRHDVTTGEVKRMFVAPEHRGHGHSRALLRALEDRARGLGYSRMVLETGTMQPEAMALYEHEGYTRIGGYGYYGDAPHVRCYGKEL